MSPEICSTTVRIDHRRNDGDATDSMMTAATALVEENDQDDRQMFVRPDHLSCPQQVSFSNCSRWLEQTAALSPGMIDGSNTSSKIPQFNLTKIEHNRLTVRCLLRAISYEKSVFDHTTDLHEISCSKIVPSDDVTTTSPSPQHRNLIGCSIAKVSWWPTSDCYRRTLEVDFNRRYNYGKRRLKTSDSQLSQSHSSIIYFILNFADLLKLVFC